MVRFIFFFSVFTLISYSSIYSQTVNDVMIKDIDVKYIEIVGTPRTISNKMNVEIQFGQKGNLVGAQNTKIKGSDGSRIFFNSMVDALNFMDKYGYKYLDSYTTSANETTTYHYILIKKREEEIVSEN